MPVPIDIDVTARTPRGAFPAVAVRAGHLTEDAPGLDEDLASVAGFKGEAGQTLLAQFRGRPRLLLGVGSEPGRSEFRRAGAAAARTMRRTAHLAVAGLGLLPDSEQVAGADGLAEGLALGSYAYADYKEPAEDTVLERATILADGDEKRRERIAEAVAAASRRSAAVALARDLVNAPGGDLTPTRFSTIAREVAADHGLEIEVWDRERIIAEGCGGLAGVARGSEQEPQLVHLVHRPSGRRKVRGRIALVGKGITFDSGGLSLKPAKSMEGMKNDMAGAAATLGAMMLVPEVAPGLEVHAFLSLTDNMTGPDATRVGDILRIRNGKTVEVLNTDAEGRLVLADALSLAVETEPDAIIDLATLTGACVVALGERTAGLLGNDEELTEKVMDAAEAVGEPIWPLPIPDHLRKTLDSDIADLRNIGTGPYGGTLSAAAFLREFVAEVPWAHLDIAGPASTSAVYDEHGKGGTGYGVRTLARLLGDWA